MSDEIVAIFGKVSQVRDYASLGLTRIIIDIPVEFHVNATAMLYGQDVLVTMAPKSMAGSPYGPRKSNGEVKPPEKGGPLSELAGQWCRQPGFQKWLRKQYPEVGAVDPKLTGEQLAREIMLVVCHISSRKQLDHDEEARKLFDTQIRNPFKVFAVEDSTRA